MDLYSLILKNGGQLIQDGWAVRDILSKDGSKIIRQFAQKNGTYAHDVFDRVTGTTLSWCRKTAREDGSFLSRVYDATGLKQFFAVQKIGEKGSGSFMGALFNSGIKNKKGDFIYCVNKEVLRKGPVTYMPPGKTIMPKDTKLLSRTNAFISQFGKFDLT